MGEGGGGGKGGGGDGDGGGGDCDGGGGDDGGGGPSGGVRSGDHRCGGRRSGCGGYRSGCGGYRGSWSPPPSLRRATARWRGTPPSCCQCRARQAASRTMACVDDASLLATISIERESWLREKGIDRERRAAAAETQAEKVRITLMLPIVTVLTVIIAVILAAKMN